LIIFCLTDGKLKKKIEAASLSIKKLHFDKDSELKLKILKDSYINLFYHMRRKSTNSNKKENQSIKNLYSSKISFNYYLRAQFIKF